LFEGSSSPARFVADEGAALATALLARVRPDATFSPAYSDLGFIHRSAGDAEIYFLANTSNLTRNVKAVFRVQGMKPEWWDPYTGNATPAVESQSEAGITVNVDLEAYGTRVLVFTKRSLGASTRRESITAPAPIDLSTRWKVTFSSTGSPEQLDSLRSWTDDETKRYFSGVATYEKTVTVPDSLFRDGLDVRLDFGEGRPLELDPPRGASANAMQAAFEGPIREAAVLYINDRRAGSVWHPPYSIDVTGLLRRGENRIRVLVANTAINHMAGHALPDYRLLNLRYGERFQVQDLQKVRPIPSGMLGPVRLIATPH
jgi:hypothetical protein